MCLLEQSWVSHHRASSLGHSEKPWEEDMLAQKVNSSIYQILLCVRRWGYREKDSLTLHRVQSSRKITHNADSQSGKKRTPGKRRQHLGIGWIGTGYKQPSRWKREGYRAQGPRGTPRLEISAGNQPGTVSDSTLKV